MAQIDEHRQRLNNVVAAEYAYPAARFRGRGVVICAGGVRYFTNAYVCASILRMHGCTLPIQFWHLGPKEINDEMRELVRHLDVECIDALEVRKTYPARILKGWELKSYAILHCPFEEVLFLDSDNVAVKNPEFLFSQPQYIETGAIFWPDYGRLAPTRDIWDIVDVPYRDEPEFESGQIVVDKCRCWKALQVTMHLNEWSDFYYKHVHGDKETFHMAWRRLDQPYAMPPFSIHALPGVMCQHDFDGARLFQHRNMQKWRIDDRNPRIKDFWFEDECLRYVDELRAKWSTAPKQLNDSVLAQLAQTVVAQRYYTYIRVGHDFRTIELLSDGRVQSGKEGALETSWAVIGTADAPRVGVFSDGELLAQFELGGQGMLHGQWVRFEEMPCVLVPSSEVQLPVWVAQYGEDKWMAAHCELPATGVYVEVGAADGVKHSNTYWLERKGWRGLIVEADSRNLAAIRQQRSALLEHCAATNAEGTISFTQHSDRTLSGVLRPKSDGAVVTVPGRRLDALLASHSLGTPDVLSIDTEGSELDVLDGLGAVRPKYLIVEYLTIGIGDANAAKSARIAKLHAMGYQVVHTTPSNLIARYGI